MRIGELSTRTHVSTRLLRYYEEQGLLAPERGANGYREYGDAQVDRVAQIRGLLDAGLPVRIIQQVLPCLDNPCTIHVTEATPEMIATLEHERDRMDARIRCLARNRDAITEYLAAVRTAATTAPTAATTARTTATTARTSASTVRASVGTAGAATTEAAPC